ncbi:uncharacterized protein LOC123513130 isoform X2 [Portunus trituberculatus]|uniref:uncharacterized protein LOC123513130 isoform X2 n=1 Tax=Portunus trituberculatus TaxID=210409 RepID=UPI001E1D1B7D|nr:uncharacterized protein LOC123513130 isoform X2 [Portunus trituberculatus]
MGVGEGWAGLLSDPTSTAGPGDMLLFPDKTTGSPTTPSPDTGPHRGLFRPQGVPGERDAGLQSSPVTPHPDHRQTAEEASGGQGNAADDLAALANPGLLHLAKLPCPCLFPPSSPLWVGPVHQPSQSTTRGLSRNRASVRKLSCLVR